MSLNLTIHLSRQTLEVSENDCVRKTYLVSTSSRGGGEQYGSYKTPRGRHVIRAKIGDGLAINTIFVERRPVGVWAESLGMAKDWVLTRILWLSGCEPGFNRLGEVDTMRRFVYIHGSLDTVPMGAVGSHGCIRMRNTDLLELFEQVVPGTQVDIIE